tara:strand:- start:580 stop:1335 length:756 start_codon:yes stop_codon:yes gene_type:complete
MLHIESPDLGGGNPLVKFKYTNNSNNPLLALVNETAGGNSTDNLGLFIDNRGGSGQSYSIRVKNNTSEILAVRADGKVGLGTASPSGRLHVKEVASTHNHVYLETITDGYASYLNFKILARTSGAVDAPLGDIYWYNGTDSMAVIGSQVEDADGNSAYIHFKTQTNGALAERMRISSAGFVTPGGDNTQDLGSAAKRWRNLYVGDMQLSNEGNPNEIDGTTGKWTIQEGDENLFVINRITGKKFKMNLTEV